MKAYELMQDVPGLKAGTVFVHDKKDSFKGSIACGCLKNAWDNGNCQRWAAETHIFPGQLIDDLKWFKRIVNPVGTGGKKHRYTCDKRILR